jgi:2-polyprenyl-3-methyl-5-hydroxy-6-metoxy-1,4-benzoquinol methylase
LKYENNLMKINLSRKEHKIVISEENYLAEPFERCPFCNSASINYIGNIRPAPDINIYTDFLSLLQKALPDRPLQDIKICTCKNCHVGFFNPQPTERFLLEFYNSYDVGNNERKKTDYRRLSSHLAKYLGHLTRGETIRILDFGGGDGAVSQCLGQSLIDSGIAKKINISVVDFNTVADRNENPISQNSFQTLDQIPSDDEFDIIIASATLEHVKNPRQIVSLLLQKLKKQGIFYARTPYSFPFYKLFKKLGLKFGMPYPAHLFDMGSYFWSDLLKTMNLSSNFLMKKSRTSIVHASFRNRPLIFVLSHLFKLPSYLIGKSYPFSGGWEVVIERKI